MALQGLAEMTLGVPRVDETRAFYTVRPRRDEPGVFATADGGDQLRVVERPYRQLVEYVLSAADPDDVERVRAAASRTALEVTEEPDGGHLGRRASRRHPGPGHGA